MPIATADRRCGCLTARAESLECLIRYCVHSITQNAPVASGELAHVTGGHSNLFACYATCHINYGAIECQDCNAVDGLAGVMILEGVHA